MTLLATKLSAVMAAIDVVAKRGENKAQGYAFVKATDVAREVRAELVKVGVAFTLGVEDVRTELISRGDKPPFVMFTVLGKASFIDGETGESLVVPFAGAGGDYGGEKGIYKAITGGLKYLLRMTFLIPDEEDPEVPLSDADERPFAGLTIGSPIPTGASITVLGATAVVTDNTPDKLANDRQKAHLRATAREKGLDGGAFKAFIKAVTDKESSKDLTVANYEEVMAYLGGAKPEYAALVRFYSVWTDETTPMTQAKYDAELVAPAVVAPVA